MADVTWGVKVPEELKEQINRLMQESGLQGKDFMQQVIDTYVLELAKEQIPEIAQDLRELQGITQRINDIYLNMGYRMENLCESQKQSIDKQLMKQDEIITELSEKLKESREKYENLVELYNEKINNINELNDRLEQIIENNESLKSLNREYAHNISDLEGKIQKYRELEAQNHSLREENSKVKEKLKGIEAELDTRDIRIRKLDSQIRTIKIRHKEELEVLNQEFDVKIDKMALSLEKEHIKKVEDIKADFRERLERQQHKEEEVKRLYEGRIGELMTLYREVSMQLLEKKDVESSQKDVESSQKDI